MIENDISGGPPKYFWLHFTMLVIWTATVFMIGISWQQPDCKVRVYRHLENDDMVIVCVIEPSSRFEVNMLNETD